MALEVRKVGCYAITVPGNIAEASKMLAAIAESGVDFLAYQAVPADSRHTRFTLIPVDDSVMSVGAEKAGLKFEGPDSAVIITGDERPGALAEIYGRLNRAGIHVEESSGMAHIRGGYGVILYLQKDDCGKAMAALRQ
ncbi:MAG: hypothetical protein JW929_14115 [Anaerolineales bacterium]|nr:hypothetical protein [Anaerolineales bacterium]